MFAEEGIDGGIVERNPARLLDRRIDCTVEAVEPVGVDEIGDDGGPVAVNGLDDVVHTDITGKYIEFTCHGPPLKLKGPERRDGSFRPFQELHAGEDLVMQIDELALDVGRHRLEPQAPRQDPLGILEAEILDDGL